jgi:hypothetical protein
VESKARALELAVESGHLADIQAADRIVIPSGLRLEAVEGYNSI